MASGGEDKLGVFRRASGNRSRGRARFRHQRPPDYVGVNNACSPVCHDLSTECLRHLGDHGAVPIAMTMRQTGGLPYEQKKGLVDRMRDGCDIANPCRMRPR